MTQAVGDLTITTKPKDAMRLDITDPTGKTLASGSPYQNPSAAVGAWKVAARASGYEEQTLEFTVAPDDSTLQKLELKRLGGLKVAGTPEGGPSR